MIVIIFALNGIAGIRESIPTQWLGVIDLILSIAAIKFRISQKQNFNA